MKLVAKRDFSNVPALGLDAKQYNLNPTAHVPKGLRFSVGATEIFDDLKKPDQLTVAQLIVSKAAVIDNAANKDIIAKIDAEVKSAQSLPAKAPAKE